MLSGGSETRIVSTPSSPYAAAKETVAEGLQSSRLSARTGNALQTSVRSLDRGSEPNRGALLNMNYLNAVLLGLIEGITEFLPISSTGHLLSAEHWLGQRSETFNVVIQAGAILKDELRRRLIAREMASRSHRAP
jgi:Bacitracin resistance protein BacA